MQHKIAKYLFDIDDCITAINNSIGQDKSFNDYVTNRQLRRSIERELEIIGEAINKLKKLDDTIDISYYRQIISVRNQIIHSYDNIDNETIWGIVIKHLPVLKKEVEQLLKK